MSAKAPRKKIRWDLWMIVTVGVSIFYMLFLLYPLISMLSKSVIGEDGGFTWQYFAKVFHKKYYQRAVWGSLKISATVTLITVLLATPLAYIMSTVKIRFAGALQILILVSSMSAPFIGAYACSAAATEPSPISCSTHSASSSATSTASRAASSL